MSPPQDIGDQALLGSAQPSDGAYRNVDDLKVYFQFEEASGDIENLATAKGSSSSLGTGADLIGDGDFTDYHQVGIIEYGLGFDGYNDWAEFGTSLSQFNFFHGTGDWSINFWFKMNAYINEARWIDNIDSGAVSGITLRNGGDADNQSIKIYNSSGDLMVNDVITLDSSFPTGTYKMVTWTCDYSDTANCYELFIDAVSQGTLARGNAGSVSSSNVVLEMMRENGSNSFLNDGRTDEWSIWERVLSGADITSLYNGGDGKVIDGT